MNCYCWSAGESRGQEEMRFKVLSLHYTAVVICEKSWQFTVVCSLSE